MSESKKRATSRRRFLAAATGLAAGAVAPRALADNAKNLPPNVADWTRTLGDGVAVRAYGHPSKHEKHVVRRDVQWLTASRESSVSFTPLHELDGIITPSGLCFERHHSGIAEIDPADYRLMLHGLVGKPLMLTLADLKRFPRTSKIHFLECAANTGMEWRGAQLNGCQYTHGMVHCVEYTGVPLKTLLAEAGLKNNAGLHILELSNSLLQLDMEFHGSGYTTDCSRTDSKPLGGFHGGSNQGRMSIQPEVVIGREVDHHATVNTGLRKLLSFEDSQLAIQSFFV